MLQEYLFLCQTCLLWFLPPYTIILLIEVDDDDEEGKSYINRWSLGHVNGLRRCSMG